MSQSSRAILASYAYSIECTLFFEPLSNYKTFPIGRIGGISVSTADRQYQRHTIRHPEFPFVARWKFSSFLNGSKVIACFYLTGNSRGGPKWDFSSDFGPLTLFGSNANHWGTFTPGHSFQSLGVQNSKSVRSVHGKIEGKIIVSDMGSRPCMTSRFRVGLETQFVSPRKFFQHLGLSSVSGLSVSGLVSTSPLMSRAQVPFLELSWQKYNRMLIRSN